MTNTFLQTSKAYCKICRYQRERPNNGIWCIRRKAEYIEIREGFIINTKNSEPTDHSVDPKRPGLFCEYWKQK